MVVKKDVCPNQANLSTGFKRNYDCPYVETTPEDALSDDEVEGTYWNKMFRVYGNRHSFTLWNIGEGAYIRMRDSFMPVYNNNGRARHYYSNWDRWPASRLPLKWQIDWPVVSKSMWEFDFESFNRGDPLPVGSNVEYESLFYTSLSRCNRFTLGNRAAVQGFGTGDTLFATCQWGLFFPREDLPRLGTVEWNIYSTSWGTGKKNGNNRNRNQVLMWTQRDRKCCASQGRGDAVTQGVWQFVTLDGSVFRLPASGSL